MTKFFRKLRVWRHTGCWPDDATLEAMERIRRSYAIRKAAR